MVIATGEGAEAGALTGRGGRRGGRGGGATWIDTPQKVPLVSRCGVRTEKILALDSVWYKTVKKKGAEHRKRAPGIDFSQ